MLPRQLLAFGIIGASLTGAYIGIYLLLTPLGDGVANITALTSTTLANIGLNRRFTFKSGSKALKDWSQSLVVFAAALLITTVAVEVLPAVEAFSRTPKILLAVAANLLVTGLRFIMLRNWVYRRLRT